MAMAAGLPKAAASMARRAVQGVVIDKGAKKGTLFDQLSAIASSSVLHPALVEWAQQIRLLGNMGAHPGEDGLETVSLETAREIVRFLDELLKWTYEMPADLERSKVSRGIS